MGGHEDSGSSNSGQSSGMLDSFSGIFARQRQQQQPGDGGGSGGAEEGDIDKNKRAIRWEETKVRTELWKRRERKRDIGRQKEGETDKQREQGR